MKSTLLHFAEKLKKPLHILTAFAVIICTAFSVPFIAFADEQVVPVLLPVSDNPVIDGLQVSDIAYVSASANYVYGFYYYSGSTPIPVFASETQANLVYRYYSSNETTGNFELNKTDNTNNLYYYNSSLWSNPVYLPLFQDLATGLSAVRDYIDNGGGVDTPSTWVNKPLVIPQGYTAVIITSDMTAGKGGFRLRANTGNLGNSNLWRDIFGNDNVQSGQSVYSTNTSITSYDFDDYQQLTWSPYEYSLLRATAYEYIGEATKSYTYTYIFNPIQGNATSIKNGQNTNGYITLYMNEQFDGTVKLYPLTSLAAVGQGQTIDVGNDDSENAGSGDISNGTWTNSNGNVFTPPQGGGNGTGSSQNPLEAIAGTVEHLGEVLNQFVGGLSTILTAPVEAIQTLINNGSAFVSHLSGLYSWLPTQVYSTLTSAIILCITVGVLKVLL